MPIATLEFDLPDEQTEFRSATQGSHAKGILWDIDQRLRGLLKHGDPSESEARLAEEVRQMIRDGCCDALEL